MLLLTLGALAGCADEGTLRAQRTADEPVVGDWFVATWGSDSASGSLEHPFRTLNTATNHARPGDIIMLRGGTYDRVTDTAYIVIQLSGTPDDPITIRSYPGERAIIDGQQHSWHPRTYNDGRSMTNPHLLDIRGDHLIIQDLTLRNGVGRGLYLTGHHNTLRGLITHNNHSDGIHIVGGHNLIEDIESYDNHSIANGGDSADGIKIMNYRGVLSTHNTIRRAILHHNSDDGIDIWDSTHTLIEHSIAYENGDGPTGNGVGYKLGTGIAGPSNAIIRYSIAFNNRANNFDANRGGGITMIHNTSWRAREHGFVLRNTEGTNPPNTAHNNISYQDNLPYASHTTSIHSHNSWNLYITNPDFISLDPSSPNFLTLTSTSPAINAGKDLGLPHTGTAPDLGSLQQGQTLTTAIGNTWLNRND